MTQFAGAASDASATGADPVDLTNCDREPIHIPGAVQPHGVLLALSEPGLEITQVSENAERLLCIPVGSLLGGRLALLLGEQQMATLRRSLAGDDLNENPLYLLTLRLGSDDLPYNAVFHRKNGVLIAELEPATAGHDITFQSLYRVVRTGIAELQDARSVLELCQLAARETRRISGFDRVMIYRFDAEDWHGEVIAEDKGEGMAPFLGLHYPASDIPRQARDLYVSNRIRLIADVAYVPARLVPELNPQTGKPLDLSFAFLRSVSPVHVEYLRNMGVAASMSVSIVKDGQLWGLIACHHPEARQLPYEARAALDLLGQVVSMQLAAKAIGEEYEHRMRLKTIEGRLLRAIAGAGNLAEGLAASGPDLLTFAGAGGAAIYADGRVKLIGAAPDEAQVRELVEWLASEIGEDVFDTDALPAEFPPAAAYKDRGCGVLAVSASRVRRTFVLWFRPEVIRTVNWSGDPHKPATAAGAQRLHPRKSFELWQQEVHDHSARWQDWEVRAAAELRKAVDGIPER
jgi:two-component system, chemotaxis family, sensor kinase Cph1